MHVAVVKRYPHDPKAFTQGLLYHDGFVYESTGQYGQSSLRRVRYQDGSVVDSRPVERTFFAEGLARVGDTLIQLTWREHRAFVWRLSDLKQIGEHRYEGAGWGLCFDGTHLVMSDGTDTLTFRNPRTFEVTRKLKVTKSGRAASKLNELECVGDHIYANRWQTPEIVKIEKTTGTVVQSIDAGGLLTQQERRRADVLNGIAFLPESGHFLLTGKNWPWLYEVRFVEN